ncbi:MAG: DUF3341 domain-containing protein [Myxococcales bacterium]|nr:DUF3341 domain-containing protein [Myxococcales bacterium]MCB9579251.1 DUF3341 domain-containing protein [Polyangiaceae bacterium]
MRRVLLAEFESSDACAGAISKLKASGHSELDAYMPFPAKNVEEALALPKTPLPKWVLAGGLTGAALAYFILWWTQNVGYPLDVGSHPTHSVPAYIGITFETAVLFASFTAFLGMLRLCRLPRLYHPVFDVEGFERASVDRFFVSVGTTGESTERRLLELGALRVVELDLGEEAP